MGHSEQGNKPNNRPSLLSNSDEKNTNAVNILSGLEGLGTARPSATSSRKKIIFSSIIAILLAGVAATVFYAQDSTSSATNEFRASKPNPSANSNSALSNAPVRVTTAANLPVEQLVTSSASNTSADRLTEKSATAAIIINEASEKLVVKNEENPFSNMLSNEKNATSTSLPASPNPIPTSKKVVSSTATNTVGVSDKLPSEKSAKNSSIANNEVKKEVPVKSKTSNSAESDIALISALISRDSDNHKAKPDKHTQDIVERKPGDKTKNLLARCKNLGGLEADLCRSRICLGQWANESACQAPETTSTRANSNAGSTSAEPSKESKSSENTVALANNKI